MFELDRRQVLVYAAVAVAVVVIGLVSLKRSKETHPVAAGTPAGANAGSATEQESGGLLLRRTARVLVVDVAGAVKRPGVYRMSEGARVIDAVRKAGGATKSAELQAINRAALLADGQQVVVPASAATAGEMGDTVDPASGSAGPVSLGSATQADLEQIDGIGPVTARKIIDFRDGKGGLSSVEDLDQVDGIGPATMESLRSALQP